MSDLMPFHYSGRDIVPQFTVFMLVFGGGCIPIPFMLYEFAGLYAVMSLFAVVFLLSLGSRFSVVANHGCVVITRNWFGIPYWRHTGHGIDAVFYDGDYGDAEGATGVVVVLDGGREIHIGSVKSMHVLHSSLLALKRHYDDGRTANAFGNCGP